MNFSKYKNLSGGEIQMLMSSRALVNFGLGILVMNYFPRIAIWLAIPSILIGLVLLVWAGRGFFRKTDSN
jgi:membrane protein implicated in regulation of membrane protease activity